MKNATVPGMGTDGITNVQALCARCNGRKNDKIIDYRTDEQRMELARLGLYTQRCEYCSCFLVDDKELVAAHFKLYAREAGDVCDECDLDMRAEAAWEMGIGGYTDQGTPIEDY